LFANVVALVFVESCDVMFTYFLSSCITRAEGGTHLQNLSLILIPFLDEILTSFVHYASCLSSPELLVK